MSVVLAIFLESFYRWFMCFHIHNFKFNELLMPASAILQIFKMLMHNAYICNSFIFRNDKVKTLMAECLNCLSYVLEYAPLEKTFGKPTEELLNYLKFTFILDPLSTLGCVQALLRCIFGTNASNQVIVNNENIPRYGFIYDVNCNIFRSQAFLQKKKKKKKS